MTMYSVTLTVILAILALTNSCSVVQEDSTPESTIEKFLDGHNRGDKAAIQSTMLEPRDVYIGEGKAEGKFIIIEKRTIAETSNKDLLPGDIEIRTQENLKWKNQIMPLITVFYLRRVGGEWKITDYHAYPAKSPGLEMR